jgi:hypothetical protein
MTAVTVTWPNGHENAEHLYFCGECGIRIQTGSESIAARGHVKQLTAEIDAKKADFESGRITLTEFETFLDGARAALKTTAPVRSSSMASSSRGWPPNAKPYVRRCLIAATAASASIMVGSVGPWVTALITTVNGLDAGNWGLTALTLGAVSCVALLTELFWLRTTFNPRWAVPLAWAAGAIL